MIWSLFLPLWWANPLYTYDDANGIPTLTDKPVKGATVFYSDKPLPLPGEVDLSRFPLLDSFDPLIREASVRYGVPAALIKAVCVAESGMNPEAVSRAGAKGLMQLMPATAESLGVTDPFDPEQSIRGGTQYLSRQIAAFGSLPHALAAYNAGPQRVKEYHGIPPFKETQTYVTRVMSLYDYFRHTRPLQ